VLKSDWATQQVQLVELLAHRQVSEVNWKFPTMPLSPLTHPQTSCYLLVTGSVVLLHEQFYLW
jgi:hypothetical protein